MDKDYEIVIGVEVHVELKTKTKIFCACTTEFGGEPNTHCCPVCMGLPGTLPVLNEEVVNYAIQAGLATNCEIARNSKQDRKHYFYPDLPTSYQISQDELPICRNGHLDIEVEGNKKTVGITRIHIEEDAGKLIHRDDLGTLVDYNRSGVPLIEIVSEPDLRSAEETRAFLQKLRAIMLYIGVSDCKMNEGSFRCDLNLSVRKKGGKEYGTRTEMKNLNSFQSVMRAVEYEAQRQIKEIKDGGTIIQETRRFDQNSGKTFSMRTKEDAQDYRYLPDADLMPIVIDEERIEKLKKTLPDLPDVRKKMYMEKYGLNSYDAEQLISSIDVADYFEEAVKLCKNPKTLANIMITEVFRIVDTDDFTAPFSYKYLAELVDLLEDGTINSSTSKKILEEMIKGDKPPSVIVKEKGLEQINDIETLLPIIQEAIKSSEKAVKEYKGGKEKALQAIIGKIMGKTRGKANPETTIKLLKENLK
ncbi:MAG: Asp-tRNA(Asn)/Glu-tRNA(Gln) amidotransferase subunit GatB [Candidatus Alkaliphilus sp. MAG34]|nr:Asp-tRNA(Asn)/Glu-tRNA(Gln) amidotransferase subunit GatB [Clostridiales bacterium]